MPERGKGRADIGKEASGISTMQIADVLGIVNGVGACGVGVVVAGGL